MQFLVCPIEEKATLDAIAARVDVALGYPCCECTACRASRGLPSAGPGLHNVSVSLTYALVTVDYSGSRCAYLYDDTVAGVIGPMSSGDLPADWFPPDDTGV